MDATAPTTRGFILCVEDALIVVEACLQGILKPVTQRLKKENNHLIKSGDIFVIDGEASGITRWTDGLDWSPSRMLGSFLVYRQLKDGITKEEKKRARNVAMGGKKSGKGADNLWNELSQPIVNDLYHKDGLVKIAINVAVKTGEGEAEYHVVCYHSAMDIPNRLASRVTVLDNRLEGITPREELFWAQGYYSAPDYKHLGGSQPSSSSSTPSSCFSDTVFPLASSLSSLSSGSGSGSGSDLSPPLMGLPPSPLSPPLWSLTFPDFSRSEPQISELGGALQPMQMAAPEQYFGVSDHALADGAEPAVDMSAVNMRIFDQQCSEIALQQQEAWNALMPMEPDHLSDAIAEAWRPINFDFQI